MLSYPLKPTRIGVGGLLLPPASFPSPCFRSPEPPRNQIPARGLRPGTPPPPGPGCPVPSPGEMVSISTPIAVPQAPPPRGSSRLPRPRLRSGRTPQALRLAFLPPLQSRRRCGWSQDLRGEGPPGRGRRGGAVRQGGVGPGRGPGEATLTWLLRILARLTTINPLAERGGRVSEACRR